MAELRWKPNPQLSRKENEFVRQIVTNPKISTTEAVVQSYETKSRASAAVLGNSILKRPAIIAELAKYSQQAENNLVKLADVSTDFAQAGGRDGAAYAAVSERVNNSILDRLHGKATQRVETQSQVVTLNIDLTA